MQEFIQSAVSQLGLNEDQAKSATGGLLNLLRNQGGGNEAQTLIAKLPGAEDLMQSAARPARAAQGLAAAGCRGPDFGDGSKRRCLGCLAG